MFWTLWKLGVGLELSGILESEGVWSLKISKIVPRHNFGVLDILESEAARRGDFGIGVHHLLFKLYEQTICALQTV